MVRVLTLAKTVASLLAIELFVPGGTLIVLTLLVSGRTQSPWLHAALRRVPALSWVSQRLASNASLATWP
jgi:hypothetical protein